MTDVVMYVYPPNPFSSLRFLSNHHKAKLSGGWDYLDQWFFTFNVNADLSIFIIQSISRTKSRRRRRKSTERYPVGGKQASKAVHACIFFFL